MQQQQHQAPDAAQNRSPELLLLLCTRWPQREPDRQLIRAQCSLPLDWPRFLLLAKHHRLVPLVSRNLHASIAEPHAPELEEVLCELRQLAEDNVYQALRSLAELRRILQRFQSHNLFVRVLKGLPLAQSVFGDLGLRAVGDLDLLIDVGAVPTRATQQDAILQADRILRSLGYCGLFQMERFTPRQLSFYRAHWKDIAYRNPTTGFEIDLHWGLFRNREMPGSNLCATTTDDSISFGDLRVQTLPAMEGLLYLCIHGALDGWLYLKSLADVAAQVRPMSGPQLDALATLAADHGVLPELTAALALVRRYLAMNHWSARLLPENDPTVAHILRYADRALLQNGFLADREAIPISRTLAFELGLRRSLRYRCELLLRVLFRARMWQSFLLPDALFYLYPLLSPIEWALFRLRRSWSKPTSRATPSI
jgi:hypothetical protein